MKPPMTHEEMLALSKKIKEGKKIPGAIIKLTKREFEIVRGYPIVMYRDQDSSLEFWSKK